MTDLQLSALAVAAGIEVTWKDVFGTIHTVGDDTLRAVLASLGYPAGTAAAIADSLHRCRTPAAILPPLITADAGSPIYLPAAAGPTRLLLEDGRVFEGHAEPAGQGCLIPAILEPGYHRLEMGDRATLLAVAPHRCFTAPQAMQADRGWGLSVQLYALRRPHDAGLGDFAALAGLAAPAARHGAHALGISPVHAQFTADPDRFSPYAPSSRTALNVLHASIDTASPALSAKALVDWPQAARFRLAELRRMFAACAQDGAEQAGLSAFRATHGERLRAHAEFEALHGHFFGRNPAQWHWNTWPAEYHDPAGAAVIGFAAEHAAEVSFHAWLQYRADRGLAAAQQACRDAGMGIGLISDLAVGTDSGGSQCWSRQRETLLGLTVGAPPDLMQRDGQNWGLTAFSPTGLVASGFATYREMLQTALAHAGGMRIDHAMGLNRLWVIPQGAAGAQGAYLRFPETDLLRLIRLESARHRAIILAEDLGTVPEGFQDRLRDSGIEGMRVLWFEYTLEGTYVPPAHWTQGAAAMTSTHDLPTLAGWWSGRDIAWREEIGQLPDADATRAERARDRVALWTACQQSGAAQGDQPGCDETDRFVDAACVHVGGSGCELVMLPIEDALGLVEQPNLPGTLDEHPNWRRRLELDVDAVLDGEKIAARLAAIGKARG